MSVHTKKRHTNSNSGKIRMQHDGIIYLFPKKVADNYRITEQAVSIDEIFANINKRYTKPGALLKAIRIRENLTQIQMAQEISVTQSDISQIENGQRRIGRKLAQRIAKLFNIDYRLFLE